ncbi:unnamed protein product [Urochloa decumbens]|uniref:Uncharacterized protein n=1 Tax=Urochloa decumbens TaxID=240449 RepID=A0ABC9AND8_9POAL
MAVAGGSGTRAWVEQVEKSLDKASVPSVAASRRSIYRVPACIKDGDPNRKVYKPRVVSLGPFHHGDPELAPMEEHKQRALRHLLRRANQRPRLLPELVASVEVVAEELESAYYPDLGDWWRGEEGRERFLEMMVVDGCFLLEVMRAAGLHERNTGGDYAPDDPVFSHHGVLYMVPYIRRDMLMLENQVPLLLLQKLVAVETAKPPKTHSKANLHDVRFRHGVLSIPSLTVDDSTEYMFANTMAFERLHVGAGNDVTAYVFFMGGIVKSAKDVAVLSSSGIIQNAAGSDEAAAKMFAIVSKDVVLEPESALEAVQREVNAYCDKPWNKWRANVIHNYFRSPTSVLNFLAAVVALVVIVVQTAYTIIAFYYN